MNPEGNPSVDSSANLRDADVHLRDLSGKERELQTRYWGVTDDNDLVRCPVCCKQGHMPSSCRARDCPYCKISGEHFPIDCPRQQKCLRCQERGHLASSCESKLARSAADGFDCDFCHGNHKEDSCSWLWRTFKPSDGVTKVDKLPMHCYQCASTAHWGDDCYMLPPAEANTSTNDVFSASFANQFLIHPVESEISVQGSAQLRVQQAARPTNALGPLNKPRMRTRRRVGHSDHDDHRAPRNYRAVAPPKSLETRIKADPRRR